MKTQLKRRDIAASNSHVGRAVYRRQLDDALRVMKGYLTDINIQAYLTEDGAMATELLCSLARIIGVGAEIGMCTDKHSHNTRRMHAALRTIAGMSIDGNRWKSAQARGLHEAAVLGLETLEKYPVIGVAMLPGAIEFSENIKAGTVRMDAIAGPEIYQEQMSDAVDLRREALKGQFLETLEEA